MAGLFIFFPLRVVAQDKLYNILLCLGMRNTHKIIDVAVADLTPVFHFTQSNLQQQLV